MVRASQSESLETVQAARRGHHVPFEPSAGYSGLALPCLRALLTATSRRVVDRARASFNLADGILERGRITGRVFPLTKSRDSPGNYYCSNSERRLCNANGSSY